MMIGKPDNPTMIPPPPYPPTYPGQPAIHRMGNRIAKRTLDVVVALVGLLLFGWLILLGFLLATLDTRQNGFFVQARVGKDGRLFHIIKLRTMRDRPDMTTTVTTARDPRVTRLGSLLRKGKIDELPQLINVLLGQMSLVGPRPDMPGFADQLTGGDRIILSIRPGITGPATLAFRNEEALLAAQADPEWYNREVIYPEKTRLNRQYIEEYTLYKDISYIFQTFIGRNRKGESVL